MAWTEALDEESFSVLFGSQLSLNATASAWTCVDVEMPQVTYDAAQTEAKRSRKTRGAGTPRLTGRVWPRVAVRFPACGQLSDYDPTSDTPTLSGQMGLLDFFGGSSAIAYQASGVEPTDGNTVSLVSSTGKVGCLVAPMSSGVVTSPGFIKDLSGAGPYAANLFEDLGAQPASGSARIPTKTYYPSTTQPAPLSIRIKGESSGFVRTFVGCVLARKGLTFDADWRPYWQCEFVAYGGEVRNDTTGGLDTVTECLPIDPLLGGNGRFVIASNVFSTYNDATVDANGTCDVRDFTLDVEYPHYPSLCPPGTEGVREVVVRSPVITCGFSLPDISDFEVGGSGPNFGQDAWRDVSAFSASLYMGRLAGRIQAINLPRLHLTAYPEPVFVQGLRHLRFQTEAGNYDGDGSSSDAGNKPLRFAVG